MNSREARASVRMPKYLGAIIEFNNRQSVVDCVVRNQSDGGAFLKIDTPVQMPNVFDLFVAKNRESYRCALVWNGPKEMGVRFCSEAGGRRSHLRIVK